MKLSTSIAALGSGLLATASPLLGSGLLIQNLKCAVVTNLVTLLQKDPQATPFCSSYLGIPVATQTSTSTITPASATVTQTATSTAPESFTTTTAIASETTIVTTVTSTQVTVYETSYSTTFSPTAISCATAAGQLQGLQPTTLSDSQAQKRWLAVPLPTPNFLRNEKANQISSACSCLNVATSTTTVTERTTLPTGTVTTTTTAQTLYPVVTNTESTTTTFIESTTITNTLEPTTSTRVITVIQPTPNVFGGLTYYEKTTNYNFGLDNPNEDVTTLRGSGMYSRTLSTGQITNLNVVNSYGGINCQLPGKARQDCSQLALVMQGFLFARQTGTHKLSIGRNGEASSQVTVDNYFGVWSGDSAYSYNNGNADFRARRQGSGANFQQINGAASYQMTSGEVKPITAIFINGGGAASYQFYLYPPGGGEVTDTSSYFIPACAQGNPFNQS